MIYDATKYIDNGLTIAINDAHPVQYEPNKFLGISKPEGDTEAIKSVLLRNLAVVQSRIEAGDVRALIFETERIDTPEYNDQRQWINEIITATLGNTITWGVFDQMNRTHSIGPFVSVLNSGRKELFGRARELRPIGNACFTPHYLKREEDKTFTLAEFKASVRNKIDCCRQAGYERVYLTLHPYLLGATDTKPVPLELLRATYIGDTKLKTLIEECETYGDGCMLWTHPCEQHQAAIAAIESMTNREPEMRQETE